MKRLAACLATAAWFTVAAVVAANATDPESIAERLKSAGAIPFSEEQGFVLPFEFNLGGDDAGSTLSVAPAEGDAREWSGAPQVRVASFSASSAVSGPVFFAGYGVVVPDGRHDSYSGVDVKDKIVVVFDGSPGDVSDDDRVEFERCSRPRYKALRALERGAKAIVFVGVTPSSSTSGREIANAMPPGRGIVAVHVGSDVAKAIFATSGHGGVHEIRARLDGGDPHVTGFDFPGLEMAVSAKVATLSRKGFNVVGKIPAAKDASRQAPGHVVLGARVDDGVERGGPGVDLVIAVGRRLAERSPARGVVLALWSGDVAAPFAPTAFIDSGMIEARSILGYVNVDALGPLRDDRLVVASLASSSVWSGIVERVNIVAGFDIEVQDDPFVPADSAAFYAAEVPAVNLFSGHDAGEGGLAEEDFARLTGFVEGLVRKLAAQDERPDFVAFEHRRHGSDDAGPARPFTGTVPDYATEADGLRLDAVIEGGPAEAAGLREGDVITEFAGKAIGDAYDYMEALSIVKIDQPVRVVFRRDGVSMETVVTPTRRR